MMHFSGHGCALCVLRISATTVMSLCPARLQGMEVQPLHDYMLNVPCISRWGAHAPWHG